MKQKNYTHIITIDADGQHDTDEIPRFIDRIRRGNAGMVIGNRLHSPQGMPLYRLFINRFFSWVTSAVCGRKIYDVSCGYRIIRKDVLRSMDLTSDRFDIEPEIIIKAARTGLGIEHQNIRCIYGAELSHIKPLQYCANFFKVIIREAING